MMKITDIVKSLDINDVIYLDCPSQSIYSAARRLGINVMVEQVTTLNYKGETNKVYKVTRFKDSKKELTNE